MNYTKEWLIQQEMVKYLFFWGHQPSSDGTITASCFSQWWESEFSENGDVYRTAEHYMMVGKADLFGDSEAREAILACHSPAEAKKWGRKVRNFDPKVWDEHKCEIVKQGNILKFTQNPRLKEYLLTTGERIIVEASPRDAIWGIGMGRNNENAANPAKWRGQNLLGFALMEVRDELSGRKWGE